MQNYLLKMVKPLDYFEPVALNKPNLAHKNTRSRSPGCRLNFYYMSLFLRFYAAVQRGSRNVPRGKMRALFHYDFLCITICYHYIDACGERYLRVLRCNTGCNAPSVYAHYLVAHFAGYNCHSLGAVCSHCRNFGCIHTAKIVCFGDCSKCAPERVGFVSRFAAYRHI